MFKSLLNALFGKPMERKFHAPGMNEDQSKTMEVHASEKQSTQHASHISSNVHAPVSAKLAERQTQTIRLDKQLNKLDYLFYEYLFGETQRVDSVNELEQIVLAKIDNLLQAPDAVIAEFPVPPASISRLVATLSNDDFSLMEFIDVVQQEPPVAAELMKLANSPSYKRGDAEVKDLNRAFMLIGAKGIKTHVLDGFVKQVSRVNPIYFKRFGEKIWQHSQQTAQLAQSYAKATNQAGIVDSAYLVGLIHDLGKIVIFQLLTESFKLVCPLNDPGSDVFKQIMSDKSLLLSAKLSKAWGLPDEITQSIADQVMATNDRTSLGQIVYDMNVISELSLLKQANMLDDEQVEEILISKNIKGEAKRLADEVLDLGEHDT
jgi:HD-like signal output (HDOD) protein